MIKTGNIFDRMISSKTDLNENKLRFIVYNTHYTIHTEA